MSVSPHLFIESGPDQGRALTVPEPGARIGRAHGNDFELKDPALSRFQCRFYFQNGLLHVADLGSTNQTLVNGKPVTETPLAPDDTLEVGEMIIRVRNNRMAEGLAAPVSTPPAAPAALARPATGSFPTLAPAKPATGALPSVAGGDVIDLGLASSPKANETSQRDPSSRKPAPGWVWAVLFGIIAAAGVAVAVMVLRPSDTRPVGVAAQTPALEIRYEKVEANAGNIFRYNMTLTPDRRLRIRLDDLASNRSVEKEKVLDAELLRNLREDLAAKDFFSLNEKYEGASADQFVCYDIALVLGQNAHRVRTLNRIAPNNFTEVRRALESFAETELSLPAISLPPEQARQLAEDAFLLGNKLYSERNSPQQNNLWRAIKAFAQVEWYLESIEPKPAIYAQSIQMGQTCQEELKNRFDQMMFDADRRMQLSDWVNARNVLRNLLEMIPDRADERYKAAQRKLLDVERKIN